MERRKLLVFLGVIAVIAVVVISSLYVISPLNVAPNEPQLGLQGYVVMALTDENGGIKEQREFHNIIVDAGFDGIADSVGKRTGRPDSFDYIAVGTGATAPASGNTTLGTEIARKQGTYSHTSGTKSWTLIATYGPGEATGAITESGMFNASTGGTLLSRQTFGVVNKEASDTLQITWTFTLSQG